MSDDQPPQGPASPVTPSAPPPEPGRSDDRKRRGLLIALIAIGAAVLVALIVVVILLLGHQNIAASSVTPGAGDTASVSGTPSATPSSSAQAASNSTPSSASSNGSSSRSGSQPTGGAFTVFSPKTTVACSSGGADAGNPGNPGYVPPPPSIMVTWKAVRSQGVYFAFGNTDGASSGLTKLPVSGSEKDFDGQVTFPCSNASGQQEFSLTLVGNDGKHVMKTWIVKNIGDKP